MSRATLGEKLAAVSALLGAGGALGAPLSSVSGFGCKGPGAERAAVAFALPRMAAAAPADLEGARGLHEACGYDVHRIQYRSSTTRAPHLNRAPADLRERAPPRDESGCQPDRTARSAQPAPTRRACAPNPRRAQYAKPTVFRVRAAPQQDVYELYARARQGALQFYDIASVQTLRESRALNGMFRVVRESEDLDLAEESDDEELFQNMREDKYLRIGAEVDIECEFDARVRRWALRRVAPPGARVVQLSALL
jgi:hypothetical protein